MEYTKEDIRKIQLNHGLSNVVRENVVEFINNIQEQEYLLETYFDFQDTNNYRTIQLYELSGIVKKSRRKDYQELGLIDHKMFSDAEFEYAQRVNSQLAMEMEAN